MPNVVTKGGWLVIILSHKIINQDKTISLAIFEDFALLNTVLLNVDFGRINVNERMLLGGTYSEVKELLFCVL